MTLQTKIDALKQIKARIKETLINKGIEITEEDTFASLATKINKIVTDKVMLDSLNAIKDVLIAKGVEITDDYSTYASLIEGLDMGYEKHLINNGTNGWYLLDPKTNWVKLCYITPIKGTWNEYQKNVVPNVYSDAWINATRVFTLPFTFSYVRPDFDTPDIDNIPDFLDKVRLKLNIRGAGQYSREYLLKLTAWVISDKRNKIVLSSSNGTGFNLDVGTAYIYAEGMIQ